MTFKPQKARLIHLWWFVATLFIIVGGITFSTIYNTKKIIERSEKNRSDMVEAFKLLRGETQRESFITTENNQYDGLTSENASRIESLLINNATMSLTEFNEILVKETRTLNNTLILWATVLTLLSIIFTFLGFMELRDRFAAVEEKRGEMDNAIQQAIREVEYRNQQVHGVLMNVKEKSNDIDVALANARNAIAEITDKFEDLSISAIEDIDEKIKEIDLLKQNVTINERMSDYNLSIQISLLKHDNEDRIDAFKNLIEKITNDQILPAENKYKILGESYYNLGNNYQNSGKYQIAVKCYNKAAELYPFHVIYLKRAQAYTEIGNFENAKKDFDKAVELEPIQSETYNYRGEFYMNTQNYKQAIEDFTKAIELNPNNFDYTFNRGLALAKNKEYEKAIEDFNIGIQSDPFSAKWLFERGLSHKSLKMIEESLDDFEKCIQLDQHNKNGYKNLAQSEINNIKEIEE